MSELHPSKCVLSIHCGTVSFALSFDLDILVDRVDTTAAGDDIGTHGGMTKTGHVLHQGGVKRIIAKFYEKWLRRKQSLQ